MDSNSSTTNSEIFEDARDQTTSDLNSSNDSLASNEQQQQQFIDPRHSAIKEICNEIKSENHLKPNSEETLKKSNSFSSDQSFEDKSSKLNLSTDNLLDDDLNASGSQSNDDDDDLDKDWLQQNRHVFILSQAGKPIYSLHGKEDKFANIFGTIQVLVNFVREKNDDELVSIHAKGIKFVFLVKDALILVSASRCNLSVHQIKIQLTDVYNQILSILTHSHMIKIFEKRKNFDLRRLLAGSERLINNILVNDSTNKKITNNVFTFLTNSIRVLPMPASSRNQICTAIQQNCSKISNLVFAVLIANNKLICIVRMNKYSINPSDLRLIFNLVECSNSFKTAESWTPICLPKFDQNGFLHAHVSYLADDCQACLLLLSVDRDSFYVLSEAKKRIVEKLRRQHSLETINKQIKLNDISLSSGQIDVPELRHFLYKPKLISQLLCSNITPPYLTFDEFQRLESIYYDLHNRIHHGSRPLKLIYEVKEKEVIFAWTTATYELYGIFEPTVDKGSVIKLINKLIKWIDKEEDVLFIKSHPTF